ncbi:Septum formation initiator [Desulfofarcimen acetoxidans DSM 771]|uniref:Septum formation initiator n=1 Tax=Desulfofarcimen acetoxidans (strain ATCC 49208 / DSM 771 / KCTC 5769 / VKM B-1644 / 5575) TaxID=485916 RepID=C8W3S3_DESAS|nr:septum formation initiator family protein [Desulfofarcimen acetoxidans]ACV61177.1 Septum formation initiator [Desulfofarcimen acetoxidans DSM 771]
MISSSQQERNMYIPPKGDQQKKVSFRLTKNKIPLIVGIIMALYLGLSLVNQFNKLQLIHNDLEVMQKEVDSLKTKNQSLREELKNVQSNAYIEQVAREKLGLVKPGEKRIVPVDKNQPQIPD